LRRVEDPKHQKNQNNQIESVLRRQPNFKIIYGTTYLLQRPLLTSNLLLHHQQRSCYRKRQIPYYRRDVPP
jgi:hypothetical protein